MNMTPCAALVVMSARLLWGAPVLEVRQLGTQLEGNFQVRRFAQAVRDLAKETNVPLLDVFQLFEDPPGGMSLIQDGCHPYAQGHALIAEAMINPVVELVRHK